jgi:hypothetical integral membrane protein (TIGR02206 family)
MNRNALHHIVPVGSSDWLLLNAVLILTFLLLFVGVRFLNPQQRIVLGSLMAVVLFGNLIVHNLEGIWQGNWRADVHLPLQMCGVSTLLSIVVLWTRKQWIYEWLICWSAGAFHAFLTPELTNGAETYHFVDYAISHIGILVAPVFATWALRLTPRKGSWWRVFLWTQLVLPVVGTINFLLDANYMYLAQRPDANNPVIVGDWPWYIVGLEFVALIHFWAFYKFHQWLANRQKTESEMMQVGW